MNIGPYEDLSVFITVLVCFLAFVVAAAAIGYVLCNVKGWAP